jgi:hypothetical protein
VTASDPASKRRAREVIVQLIGFALGILFIVWCARQAFGGDGFDVVLERLRVAPTWLVIVALSATLVSLVTNGLIFWCTIRPVRAIGWLELQAVNLLASFLNYAPFRIGLVARVAYHWRVQGMGPGLMGAWLVAVLLSICVAFVAVSLAMPLAPRVGLAGTFLVIVAASACATWGIRRVSGTAWAARWLRGAQPMLVQPQAFGLAVALRIIDIVAWTVRMVAVAAILGAPLTLTQAALLGLAAFALAQNPLGRFGFREAGVAWIASHLFAGSMTGDELTATFARIAMIESAAEAALTIPLGGIATLWCWRRFSTTPRRGFGSGRSSESSKSAESPEDHSSGAAR